MGYQGCSVAVGCHHGSTAIWIFGCRRHLSSFCLSICLSKADDQLTVSERVWNSKVLREGVRGTSLFLKVPCSAPVLPSTSLWCFHLYTDVAPLQHPCEVSFSPAMWCQIICGEQRKKKKRNVEYSSLGVRNAPSDLKWSLRKMGWQGAMADVVNHCLMWLSEIMKTCEGKAEIISVKVDGRLCRGFSSLQILPFSFCNGRADRAHWRWASRFSMQTDVPATLWPVLNLPASITFILC